MEYQEGEHCGSGVFRVHILLVNDGVLDIVEKFNISFVAKKCSSEMPFGNRLIGEKVDTFPFISS